MRITETVTRECCHPSKDLKPYLGKCTPAMASLKPKFCKCCGTIHVLRPSYGTPTTEYYHEPAWIKEVPIEDQGND